jgi:hypothetical protein
VAHALGLHALQILSQQTAAVFGVAALYALATVTALRQALAGHPLWPG